jgi:hypothetical protein
MKNFFLILAFLSIIASAVMYFVGNSSTHLSELKDFYWIPLPLGVISLLVYFTTSKK